MKVETRTSMASMAAASLLLILANTSNAFAPQIFLPHTSTSHISTSTTIALSMLVSKNKAIGKSKSIKKKDLAKRLLKSSHQETDISILTKHDKEEFVNVLADSFSEDPLFQWVANLPEESSDGTTAPVSTSISITPAKRHDTLVDLNTYIFGLNAMTLKRGTVMGVKDSDDCIQGVMCVIPSGSRMVTGWDIIRHILKKGLPPMYRLKTKADYGKMSTKRLDSLYAMTKRRKTLMKSYPQWIYLQTIGVNRLHQGKGVGGKLLRSLIATADASQAAIYLETESADNEALYKHFGFRTLEMIELFAPGDKSEDSHFSCYLMVRDPK